MFSFRSRSLELLYSITAVSICQELFSSFFKSFRPFLNSRRPRGQLRYIITCLTICQPLKQTFLKSFSKRVLPSLTADPQSSDELSQIQKPRHFGQGLCWRYRSIPGRPTYCRACDSPPDCRRRKKAPIFPSGILLALSSFPDRSGIAT